MALITGTSTGIDSRTADRVAAERMPCLLHPTSGSAQARTRSDPSQAPDTGRKLVPQPLRARHRGSQDISPRARARSAHQQHLSGTVGASTTNDSGNDRQDSCPPAPSGRWCATRETALRETIAFACSPSRQRRAHRRPTSGRDRTQRCRPSRTPRSSPIQSRGPRCPERGSDRRQKLGFRPEQVSASTAAVVSPVVGRGSLTAAALQFCSAAECVSRAGDVPEERDRSIRQRLGD